MLHSERSRVRSALGCTRRSLPRKYTLIGAPTVREGLPHTWIPLPYGRGSDWSRAWRAARTSSFVETPAGRHEQLMPPALCHLPYATLSGKPDSAILNRLNS